MDDSSALTMPQAMAAPRKHSSLRGHPVLIILFLVLGFAIAAFFIWLQHSQINYQETYALQAAAPHYQSIAQYGSNDDPMPLYYLLLHSFEAHFSQSLAAARTLSFGCLLLSSIVAYFIGRRISGDYRVGVLAAAFIGLSPFSLWFGSRATAYPLLLLFVLLNQYFFSGLLEHNRWWDWAGYIISAMLGISTHFFFLLPLFLQTLFIVFRRRSYHPAKTSVFLLCFVALLTAFAYWVHYSLGYNQFWHYLPVTGRPSATNAFIIYVQYLFGFQSVVTTTFIIAFWPLLVILGLVGVQKYVKPPLGIRYSIWAATAPILLLFAEAWLWKPLFLTSYLIVALAPFMIFLAWYFVAFNLRSLSWFRYAVLVLMVLAFLAEINNQQLAIVQDYLGQPAATTQPAAAPAAVQSGGFSPAL